MPVDGLEGPPQPVTAMRPTRSADMHSHRMPGRTIRDPRDFKLGALELPAVGSVLTNGAMLGAALRARWARISGNISVRVRGSMRGLGLTLGCAALLLAGCGGTTHASDATVPHDASTPPVPPPSRTTPTQTQSTPAAPTYRTIATETFTGAGTKVVAEYQFGALVIGPSGQPPSEVLTACNESSPPSTEGYASGQIVLHYEEGRYPLETTLSHLGEEEPTDHLNGADGLAPPLGLLAYEQEGAWQCHEAGYEILSLQPGSTTTLPVWLLVGGLNNEHPEITNMDKNELVLKTGMSVSQHGEQSDVGSQVADCDNSGPISIKLPFAKLPVTVAQVDPQGQAAGFTCRASR